MRTDRQDKNINYVKFYINLNADYIFIYIFASRNRKFIIMNEFQISVYLNLDLYVKGKRVYHHSVTLPKDVTFPFEQVISAMKVLYGSKCVISFLQV